MPVQRRSRVIVLFNHLRQYVQDLILVGKENGCGYGGDDLEVIGDHYHEPESRKLRAEPGVKSLVHAGPLQDRHDRKGIVGGGNVRKIDIGQIPPPFKHQVCYGFDIFKREENRRFMGAHTTGRNNCNQASDNKQNHSESKFCYFHPFFSFFVYTLTVREEESFRST
jgi:hypothetical protein